MSSSRQPCHTQQGWSVLLGMLVAGLLAMYGVQASSPSGMAGIAIPSVSDMVGGPSQHGSDHGSDGQMPPMPRHRYPGGPVGLGILVLAFAQILRVPAAIGPLDGLRIPLAGGLRAANAKCGRPPHSICRLAVLRL